MNLQLITDSNGEPSGVFIPIEEWERIKGKLSQEELNEIPEWHKEILTNRLSVHTAGNATFRDADDVLNELETRL